jgi:hypothetical protein
MADYSAINSYLEKHNLHYFTFSRNSEILSRQQSFTFPRYASGRYFQEPRGVRLQRHQREGVDVP